MIIQGICMKTCLKKAACHNELQTKEKKKVEGSSLKTSDDKGGYGTVNS